VLNTIAIDTFDQPIGESTDLSGSIPEPGDTVAATGAQGFSSGAGAIVVGPMALSVALVAKRQHQVTARGLAGGDVIAVDTFDMAKAGQRKRFIEQVLEKLTLPEQQAGALDDALDQQLLQLASSPTGLTSPGGVLNPGPEFFVVDDTQSPQARGLYWNGAMPPVQICNFDMRIQEHVVIRDDGLQETRLRLMIQHRGQERSIEMTAADFTSNGRLRTAIYGAALPGGDLKLGADVLRRAVIAVSDPAIRQVTTATGWTADRSRFVVPGGHVDADGYHGYDPSLGVAQVDLSGCDNAQWLGLRHLSVEQLRAVKEHVVLDLLRLHEPSVMRSLLGAAALALLRSLAAPKSRPVIWLRGLTGSGKTFLASLFMNLFGDYPLDASGRIATWGSTANFLQMVGFYHRDCLFVIDDFKPETTRRADVVRLLQNSGDGSAPGPLAPRHDHKGAPAGSRPASGDRRGLPPAERQRPGALDHRGGAQSREGYGAG
jgi:hypothetical protein